MIRVGLACVLFFVIGALFIISNESLSLISSEERTDFVRLYGLWLSPIGENIQQITGQVIAADWIPDSEQNISKQGSSSEKQIGDDG